MLYRLRLDCIFTTEDPAQDILDKANDRFTEAITINPGEPTEERSHIIYEECGHNETPPTPCVIIEEHWSPSG